MELKIPIEIVFDDVNSVIDELGKLQKYKLGEGDDMTLVNVDDVADVLARHVMAREAKESCGIKEQWIPCSERLPEAEYGESDNVLTTCIYKDAVDGYRSVKTLYYNGGVWCYPTGETFEGKVLAWMPLPEPYGGEKNETD